MPSCSLGCLLALYPNTGALDSGDAQSDIEPAHDANPVAISVMLIIVMISAKPITGGQRG